MRFRLFLATMCSVMFVTLSAGPALAADGANSPGTIPTPDSEGVYSTLTHKGDILDFLKVLGVRSHRNIVPSSRVKGAVTVNLFDVNFDEVLDAVLKANELVRVDEGPFIYIYTAKEHAVMEQQARQMVSRSYKLNYVKPADAKDLIGALLSEGSVTTLSPEVGTEEEGWTGTNCLVVRDYPEVLYEVERLLGDIDQRPLQVLVEATILTAQVHDNDELGIDFNALGGVNFEASGGVVGAIPAGQVALNGTETSAGTGFAANVTGGGLSIGIVNSNIGVFIRALETITDTVTLGNPKVLTLNRQQGQVKVGGEQGYLTTEVTATSTSQTVETLETGTILRFTPFVMDDGYIRMHLHPEDSTGEVVLKGNFALPEKTTAEVSTDVLVQDGHTIVIGGLFRDTASITRAQVPLIGNLPGIGTLFRSTSDTNTKEELIFLITPHIVKEPEYSLAGKAALEDCDRAMIGIRQGQQWHSRSRLAQDHYQRALAHHANGDRDKALGDASLACYISPTFNDALHLRDQLLPDSVPLGSKNWSNMFLRDLVEADTTIVPYSVD